MQKWDSFFEVDKKFMLPLHQDLGTAPDLDFEKKLVELVPPNFGLGYDFVMTTYLISYNIFTFDFWDSWILFIYMLHLNSLSMYNEFAQNSNVLHNWIVYHKCYIDIPESFLLRHH